MTDTKSFGIKRFEFEVETQISKRGVFSEGLSAVMFDTEKWGYIDKTGKIVIQPQFSQAGTFSEGLATVAIENGTKKNYVMIDKTGKIVIGN